MAIATLLCSLSSCFDCGADVTIHVISRPRLTAFAKCERLVCRIQGSLEDDLGLPLSNQTLFGALDDPTTERTGSRPNLAPCDAATNSEPTDRSQGASARTDESGKFCFRLQTELLSKEAAVSIKYAGVGSYESVGLVVKLADGGSPTALSVLSASNKIAVDADVVTVTVQLNARDRQIGEQPLSLIILDPAVRGNKNQEVVLGTAMTDMDGIARFSNAGARFGPPGPARLIARFAGTPDMQAAFVAWPIMRTCTVRVRAEVESSGTEVGDLADVTAMIAGACGVVSEGSVEFFIERAAQVTLPVKQGRASWRLSTYQFTPGDIALGARYVSASGAFTSEGPAYATLHLKPISNRRRALWWASGCLIVAWFAFRWQKGFSKPTSATKKPVVPSKPQSLEVEASSSPEFGWVGIVIDSHTGKPIEDACVSIVTPGFSGTRTELEAKSSGTGEFELPHRDLPPRSLLVVTAVQYLRAQWSMPSAGKLVVRLETRRRAIVRSFLQWAEKTYASRSAEPTPAQVARQARLQSRSTIDDWATKVEVAAFGPDDPSPTDEQLTTPPEDTAFGHKQS